MCKKAIGLRNFLLPKQFIIKSKIWGIVFQIFKRRNLLKRLQKQMQSLKKIKQINEEADKQPDVLRLSMDAKNKVKIGRFSRGGKNYSNIEAYDHDFGNEYITPQGIFLPKYDEVKIYFTQSTITANFIVDMLVQFWDNNRTRFEKIKKIILNQ